MKYKIRHLEDNIYQVWEFDPDIDEYNSCLFQGTLADCDAWIRLHKDGYMN